MIIRKVFNTFNTVFNNENGLDRAFRGKFARFSTQFVKNSDMYSFQSVKS